MSYSKLLEKYVVNIATFFLLNLPEGLLRRIFSEKNNFRPSPPPLPKPPPAMEIMIGPPRVPIAEYLTATRIEYIPDRFLLDISGPVEEVIEAVKRLPSFFSDLGYDLDKMVRYVEINFPPQPIDVKEAVRSLRSLVIFKGSEHLSKLVGTDVGVFSFSLSFPETPLTLNWLHLRVEPDVNSPNSRIFVNIIKRAEKLSEGAGFLTIIPRILTVIKELLEGCYD
ncbi:MAG: hypothetical protein MRT15_10355 [archaeon YNP-LCB-003-016]|uniref:hypothetical protein n=1 Tax=Candidatus Culexarchaeum yellowstonense TaxID=2928963 RepID=UPI0026EC82CE|nr:hypothetical protein [Candidatus Culexarchaeum yellowstonense]MCR6692784.1 hypothetical protein [Candidatus Culexarchaeum yellowstonense]